MRTYTCNNFHGVWPTCTAAVVMAESFEQAEALLRAELERRNLTQPADWTPKLTLLSTNGPAYVVILADGDY